MGINIMNKYNCDKIDSAIIAIIDERGPIGWYGIENRLSIPRSDFPEGTNVMTYIKKLIATGLISESDSKKDQYILSS